MIIHFLITLGLGKQSEFLRNVSSYNRTLLKSIRSLFVYPIERCQCPAEYQGQFCEECVDGYFHLDNKGPFATCIPCKCNNHADTCDRETGKCDCKDNTSGHECEVSRRSFFLEYTVKNLSASFL